VSTRVVHTCDRCGADFDPTPGSREEAVLRGAVTVVLVRPGWSGADIGGLASPLSVSLARAGAKDLCRFCSDALRAFLDGTQLHPQEYRPTGLEEER